MNIVQTQVPFFVYPDVFTEHAAEFLEIMQDVGSRGAFILQQDLTRFEENLARFLDAKYVLGVGNATDGLMIGLLACGVGAGDEVLISSHTMIATAAAVHFAGAIPVPVDCGPDHLIDLTAVEEAIGPNTRAVMPTQLNGRTCDMDKLRTIAKRHKLLIIEDAAQGLGSRFKGRCAGTFGDASAISFYPAKVLGCFGDGGAVITQDARIYERMSQLRDHGRDSRGEIVSWGLNSRLDNFQAAVLDFKLKTYSSVIARRRALAALYERSLRNVPEVALPPGPDSDPDHFDIYQNYEIEATDRDLLKQHLKDRGIGTLIQWNGQAVHQIRGLGFTQSLPRTDYLFARMLMLPMNMSVTDDQVHYICEEIRNYYGR
jgi:dTDP-4-amino-4,6-dideoxygalactose transaminase